MRRTTIERLLPAVYQRAAGTGSVLGALLEVMESLHAPDEELVDHVERLFDPYLTPDRLVPYLAGWVALDHLPPLPVGRQRDLVAEGSHLAALRGTSDGLLATLRIATGLTGFGLVEPPDRPFHVIVRVPPEGEPLLGVIRRIVELEKPAAVTCDVLVAGS